jgi:hypothetical protein
LLQDRLELLGLWERLVLLGHLVQLAPSGLQELQVLLELLDSRELLDLRELQDLKDLLALKEFKDSLVQLVL